MRSYITYIRKQPDASALGSFIKKLDYRTWKNTFIFLEQRALIKNQGDAMFIH